MAKYRKLGRTSDQRKALLRNQVTNLLYHGKIVTTETKAKEIRKIAESMIALAVKEKDNFETVTVTAKVARKDADGKRVKEVKDGKKVTVYDGGYNITAEYKRPENQISGYEYQILACRDALEKGALETPFMPHQETLNVMRQMDALRKEWGVTYPMD